MMDRLIHKIHLTALDKLISACIINGSIMPPSTKDIMEARKMLPFGYVNSLVKERKNIDG